MFAKPAKSSGISHLLFPSNKLNQKQQSARFSYIWHLKSPMHGRI